jgi:hypothetical protein
MPVCQELRLFSLLFAMSAVAMFSGCGGGQPSGRPDIDAIPEIEHRGRAVKDSIYEFRAKVKKRGVNAAKQELPELMPVIEAYQNLKLGEHTQTIKDLYAKLKELEGALAGSPTKDAVLKTVEEAAAIAGKLPGDANENPIVE